MQKEDIITISATDAEFPPIFMELKQPPAEIHALGDINLLQSSPIVSIVGTRRSTSYGKEVTSKLSECLALHDVTIVSGLAYGIDSIAHTSTLNAGGKTIAVLPSGLLNIYPANHQKLAQRIVESGGLLISEHPHSHSPMPYHFVERNRLIAALCNVLLVTEAAHQSGTIHTVRYAEKLNKTIAAVPGNITSPMSKGVNKLIFDGAQPILEPADLLSLLNINEKTIKPKYEAKNPDELTIINLLREGSLSTDGLLEESELSLQTINFNLTMLEINGVIKREKGNTWQLS